MTIWPTQSVRRCWDGSAVSGAIPLEPANLTLLPLITSFLSTGRCSNLEAVWQSESPSPSVSYWRQRRGQLDYPMTDIFTPEKRSEVMSRIRGRNTKPEVALRSLLHSLGYRFTVNGPKNKSLPGKPDIVLPKYRAVIFVHGCFWHGHESCPHFRLPKSRIDFWSAKIEGNQTRDLRNETALRHLGWHVVTIWECALKTTAARAWLKESLPKLLMD
jgi:DNA mismatch endonuclease (patch repair protein)